MTDQNLEDIVYGLVRIGTLLAVILNLGVGLVILRQVTMMNSVVKVKHRRFMSILVFGYLVTCAFVLLYIVLN